MSIQLLIFILLFGVVQGVLLILFFVNKKLHQGAYLFLLFYLGTMLLQLTLKVMSKIWLMENWPVLYQFSHWLPLLYGPFLFLFVKHLLMPGATQRNSMNHFILPATVLVLIAVAGADMLPANTAFVFFNPHLRATLLLASVFSYHVASFLLFKRQTVEVKNAVAVNAMAKLNWIKQFINVSLVASLLIVAALYTLYMLYPLGHGFRYLFSVLSICIYWFSYTALANPTAFSIVKGFAKNDAENELPLPQLKICRPQKKYAHSALACEDAVALETSLEQLMTEKKLFLQSELTISRLAEELCCSRHHLSQVLNDTIGRSFYDYINNLRMEEAKLMLADPRFSHHKIASIGYDAGFNSLSTFNEVFKKLTGKTPSEFRKETLNEAQQKRV